MTRPIIPNNPALVRYRFEQASASGKVTAKELDRIVNDTKRDGFTKAEKNEVAKSWASLFDGSSFDATRGAQQRYRTLATKHDLPQIWVK
jgi:hypothetical protein